MISLDFDITKKCNLNCKHCGAVAGCDKTSDDYDREIDSYEIKSLLERAWKAGCRILTIGGGEPLLRNDLPEILRYASGLGYTSGILTNGVLITPELASKLSQSGVNYVRVSMEYANKDRFDKYRGKGTFEKVKEALYNLKQYDMAVGIGTTIYPENIDEVDNLVDFCLIQRVDFIRFVPGLKIGRAKEQFLDFSHYVNLIEKIWSVYRRKLINHISGFKLIPQNPYQHISYPCPGGRYTYYLNPAGQIKICPFVNNDFTFDGFQTQNLSEQNEFKNMSQSMEQFMNYLPQVIGGKCASCELKSDCRGGCLATKLHNGLNIYDEQPICVKEIFSVLNSKNMLEDHFRKLVGHWFHKLAIFENRGIPCCIRCLPCWVINLSQYGR